MMQLMRQAVQALRERYPEDSETCSRKPLWQDQCETGGESYGIMTKGRYL